MKQMPLLCYRTLSLSRNYFMLYILLHTLFRKICSIIVRVWCRFTRHRDRKLGYLTLRFTRREKWSWNEKGARFRRKWYQESCPRFVTKNEKKNNTQSKKVYHPRGSSKGMITPWSHAITKTDTVCLRLRARVCARARACVRKPWCFRFECASICYIKWSSKFKCIHQSRTLGFS